MDEKRGDIAQETGVLVSGVPQMSDEEKGSYFKLLSSGGLFDKDQHILVGKQNAGRRVEEGGGAYYRWLEKNYKWPEEAELRVPAYELHMRHVMDSGETLTTTDVYMWIEAKMGGLRKLPHPSSQVINRESLMNLAEVYKTTGRLMGAQCGVAEDVKELLDKKAQEEGKIASFAGDDSGQRSGYLDSRQNVVEGWGKLFKTFSEEMRKPGAVNVDGMVKIYPWERADGNLVRAWEKGTSQSSK